MPSVLHRSWRPGTVFLEPLYLDSSIIVGWSAKLDKLHPQAVSFIGDHLALKREIYVSLLGLDEALNVLIRGLLAPSLGLHPSKVRVHDILKRKGVGVLTPVLPQLQQMLSYILGWSTLVGTSTGKPKDVLDLWMHRLQEIPGLHDSWH